MFEGAGILSNYKNRFYEGGKYEVSDFLSIARTTKSLYLKMINILFHKITM